MGFKSKKDFAGTAETHARPPRTGAAADDGGHLVDLVPTCQQRIPQSVSDSYLPIYGPQLPFPTIIDHGLSQFLIF